MIRKYGSRALLIIIMSGCANAAERNNAGISLYNGGVYDEALRAYESSQVLAPDQPEPYLNAASAYAETGKLDKARAALEQALKTADNTLASRGYYNLGNVYFQMQLYEQAVDAYQHTLLLNPGDNDARYNLELALKRIPPLSASPTPEPQSLDISVSPTDDPNGEEDEILTPSSQPSTPTPQPDVESQVQTPSAESESANTMTRDEAERLLDAVQGNETTLAEPSEETPVPPSTTEKDW